MSIPDAQNPLGYMGINPKNQPEFLSVPRAPSASDKNYAFGTRWLNTATSTVYEYVASGTWQVGGNDDATTTTAGIVLIKEDVTLAGADNSTVPTSLATKTYADNLAIAGAPDASETTKGIAELATQAETNTGTDDLKIVTPLKLKTSLAAPPEIGGTTPAAGAFTTLSASGAFSLSGDTVAVAEGGTGLSTITDHGIMVGSGTGAVTPLGVGTTGQLLVGASAADPAWATNIDLPGTLDVTGAAVLDSTLNVAGVATFTDQIDVDNININGNTISSTDVNGNINLTPDGTGIVAATELTLTTDLAVGHGGTGLSTITDHSVMIGSGTAAITPITVGTNGQLLVGSSAADPVFATVSSSDSSITFATGAGTLGMTITAAGEAQVGGLETATDVEAVAVTATDKIIVPSNLAAVFAAPPAIGTTTPAAGTFTTAAIADINASYTNHGVILGQGATTNLVASAAGSNGQLLVGSTGADPAFATVGSVNTSIAATLGAGTLSLDVDESYLQTATVTVSTGELLALATSPKQLVAAPGADKFIEFLGAKLILNYNSIVYTEAGDNLGIKYENAAGVQVSSTCEMTGFIDQAADMVTSITPTNNAIVAASGCVNKALVLDNLGSNFAAGNSPIDVQIRYRVVTAGL